jgi:hypothetical protein
MSTAEKIFDKARTLPQSAQDAVLRIVEILADEGASGRRTPQSNLTASELAELRGKLASWEEDWNAPGMEAYDKP